ncbi:MAG: hypothetical protein AAGF12_32350 [Myxococcota bacterium]
MSLVAPACLTEEPLFQPVLEADAAVDSSMDAPRVPDRRDGAIIDPLGRRRTLSTSWNHTCALRDGVMFCWGSNEEGQLGDGTVGGVVETPMVVAGPQAWVEVSVGVVHTCGLDRVGSVWCWGGNERGQLGVGDFSPRRRPTAVQLPGAAVAIDNSWYTSCARLEDDSLYCWGWNFEGQLGQDDPVASADSPAPARVVGGPWASFAAGEGHLCAVGRDQVLFCWGRNTSDNLGLGPAPIRQRRVPTEVETGFLFASVDQSHGCGIRVDGTLACWGNNNDGRVGVGDRDSRDVPTSVASVHQYRSIDVSGFSSCAIRSTGQLDCWGRNEFGRLATGDTDDRLVPTQVGIDTGWLSVAVARFHMCARRENGRIFCSGRNDRGQLGIGVPGVQLALVEVSLP